jgi:hypothetical protein
MPKEERETRENAEVRKKYDEKERRIQREIMKGTKDGGMEKGRDL